MNECIKTSIALIHVMLNTNEETILPFSTDNTAITCLCHPHFSQEHGTMFIYFQKTTCFSGFLPEHFVPVLLHVGNLVKRDVELLADPVSIFTVSVDGASSLLVQRVPVLHEDTRHLVAYQGKAGSD